jgi:hypothetical protein
MELVNFAKALLYKFCIVREIQERIIITKGLINQGPPISEIDIVDIYFLNA